MDLRLFSPHELEAEAALIGSQLYLCNLIGQNSSVSQRLEAEISISHMPGHGSYFSSELQLKHGV